MASRTLSAVGQDTNGKTEADKGIRCPVCNCGHFKVVRTQPQMGGKVMRERRCRHCGRLVKTYEKAFGDG